MFGMRQIVIGISRNRAVLSKVRPMLKTQIRHHGDHGPPAPFDNMPFRVTNRYFATILFSLIFGSGLWAPWLIIWYSMAKRTF